MATYITETNTISGEGFGPYPSFRIMFMPQRYCRSSFVEKMPPRTKLVARFSLRQSLQGRRARTTLGFGVLSLCSLADNS
jgi:hypothetical protein